MQQSIRSWLTVIGGAAVCVALIWFGWRLLSLPGEKSSLYFFVMGCLGFLGALYTISVVSTTARLAGIGLFAFSIYAFLRGMDVISNPWLTDLLGYAAFVAAVLAGYITWKAADASSKKPTPPPESSVESS